jgi:hypothetical protein
MDMYKLFYLYEIVVIWVATVDLYVRFICLWYGSSMLCSALVTVIVCGYTYLTIEHKKCFNFQNHVFSWRRQKNVEPWQDHFLLYLVEELTKEVFYVTAVE